VNKRRRQSSIHSDCEKKKAKMNQIACFANEKEQRIEKLATTTGMKKSHSLRDLSKLKLLYNQSDYTNKSTCSMNSHASNDSELGMDTFGNRDQIHLKGKPIYFGKNSMKILCMKTNI
jgi:RIO-like serine/threonine protein kinase